MEGFKMWNSGLEKGSPNTNSQGNKGNTTILVTTYMILSIGNCEYLDLLYSPILNFVDNFAKDEAIPQAHL